MGFVINKQFFEFYQNVPAIDPTVCTTMYKRHFKSESWPPANNPIETAGFKFPSIKMDMLSWKTSSTAIYLSCKEDSS